MLLKVSGTLDSLPSRSCQWTGVPRSHLLLWVAQSWTALPEVSSWQWEKSLQGQNNIFYSGFQLSFD